MFLPLFRYGINQVSPKLIITSQHLIPKLMQILSSCPHEVNHIIYFENPLKKNLIFEENEMNKHRPDIIPFSEVESNGVIARANKNYCLKPGKMIISQ